MDWRRFFLGPGGALQASGAPAAPPVMAAATPVSEQTATSRRNIVLQTDTWQNEVWGYYDDQGEFGFAIEWKANMISRVRLVAGKNKADQDEPEVVTTGLAAELVDELFGGPGKEAEMLGSLAVQLNVPGEGWLVGETIKGKNEWQVRSTEEIRMRGDRTEILDENSNQERWRPLGSNSMVVRVHRPHKRRRNRASSPARRARGVLRELELANRRIQAQYLSRLATAGLILIPDEIIFPVRPEYADAADPFIAEWIDTAAKAIATPGTAAAVVPIPMRVPADYVDKIKHIPFTETVDEQLLAKRESAIRRLALQVDVPAEILLGMGDVNHWTSWQITEDAVRAHILPDVELMVAAFTEGYLRPRLKAEGMDEEEIADWQVWYDASEITLRPDRSDDAIQVYDRLELTGEALRRETGFDDADAPDDEEIEAIILKKLAVNPATGFTALQELTGLAQPQPMLQEKEPEEEEEGEEGEKREEPKTQGEQPPNPDEEISRVASGNGHSAEARFAERTRYQAQWSAKHVLEKSLFGVRLRHPKMCELHQATCPYEPAFTKGLPHLPGTSGSYECWIEATGHLIVGPRTFPGDGDLVPVTGSERFVAAAKL